MALVKHKGMWCREGTMDAYVVDEVSCYIPLDIRREDVVLDIGGHIGAFTRQAKEAKPKSIIALEPEPDNFKLLKKNVGKSKNVTLINKAVTPKGKPVQLYVNSLKNKGTHTLLEVRGREAITVDSIKFKDLMDFYLPSVIKCDIEGFEYQLGWSILRRSAVRAVAMELHLTKDHWREEEAPALIKLMKKLGFQQTRSPVITEKNWHTLAIWHR